MRFRIVKTTAGVISKGFLTKIVTICAKDVISVICDICQEFLCIPGFKKNYPSILINARTEKSRKYCKI